METLISLFVCTLNPKTSLTPLKTIPKCRESNSFRNSQNFAIKSFFSFFSSVSKTPNTNSIFLNYLIETVNIPKSRALVISNKCPPIKSLQNPQNVRQFLHSVGFSDTHIQLAVYRKPTILFADVNKTLKPKIGYFQQLGLVGSDLAEDYNNEDLIRVIRRMSWNLVMDTEKSGLLRNIEYVKSCGIVGSQLSRSYGFSKEEFMEMFRRAPGILKSSEERLKSGLEFFLKEIEFEKAVLVHIPVCLTLSIENRVIPRYRVFQIVTSRGMLKKGWSFPSFLISSEENFLKKFVLSFGDDAEELLRAYKGHKLDNICGYCTDFNSPLACLAVDVLRRRETSDVYSDGQPKWGLDQFTLLLSFDYMKLLHCLNDI
ncbi:hypothetical protein CUMW_226040 [Citrus unshiu]|uniref:Mitochodrial transcription termination factor-related protein n=1 Tax=Citrus unshiu TaxID=55188 RepID=A0A2H5QFT5_CITUN|nr:hypothetical protein CUMW_226040 [Citrus unshiu]